MLLERAVFIVELVLGQVNGGLGGRQHAKNALVGIVRAKLERTYKEGIDAERGDRYDSDAAVD